jgi:hypothetical protein
VLPEPKLAVQTAPQEIPTGELRTVPLPVTVSASVLGTRVKVAVQERGWSIVTVTTGLTPPHEPDHALNSQSASVTFAVSCTEVPETKGAEQAAPQLMPAGLLVTLPVPEIATERVLCTRVKVAVQLRSAAIETEVVARAPAQSSDQAEKTQSELPGVAVSETVVPEPKEAEQAAPQLMPAGLLATLPVPTTATVSVLGTRVKVAVQVLSASTVTETGFAAPLHPPDQAENCQFASAGVAVSCTAVPDPKVAEQVEPQLIPAGALETLPDPTFATESVLGTRVKVAVQLRSAYGVSVTTGFVPVQ